MTAIAEQQSGGEEDRLNRVLQSMDRVDGVAVAVSGGIDSITVGLAAHRRLRDRTTLFHAVSPAVPREATARLRDLAAEHGWRLRIIDAGEFRDRAYIKNPVDRCFFCKSNLYDTIRRHTSGVILSGTNVDDLDDFRPGLKAAALRAVRHPFVEAGIDKAGIRRMARRFGLGPLAELPASPCLSSRVETGLPIDPAALALIERIECRLTHWLANRVSSARTGHDGRAVVRCRLRRGGLVVEADAATLAILSSEEAAEERAVLCGLAGETGFGESLGFEPYRRGSAFVRDTHRADPSAGCPAGRHE